MVSLVLLPSNSTPTTTSRTLSRPDSLGAACINPHHDDSGRRARLLQRRLGEGRLRGRYVLLWPRRGIAAHRCSGGERPDAGGARDSQRQPAARLAVRARAAGRIQARPGDGAAARPPARQRARAAQRGGAFPAAAHLCRTITPASRQAA